MSKFTNNYGELNTKGWMAIIVTITLVVLILVGAMAGSPLRKTPADKIGLSYGGGWFEGAQYQKTVNPGSGLVFNGWFDRWYEYPTTQRDLTVASDEVEDTKDYGVPDAIVAKTNDGVECYVQLAVTFKLNTNHIRAFHETIGLKFEAWTDDGWGKMLRKNFFLPLENAVQEQCRKFSSEDIAKDSEVYATFAKSIASELKPTINGLLGDDDFFCGPEFVVGEEACPDFQVVVKSVDLPDNVKQSLQAQATSENEIITAQNKARVQEEKARGEKAAKDAVAPALTPEYINYLRVQALQDCAKTDGCTLVITEGGNGVNVNLPTR